MIGVSDNGRYFVNGEGEPWFWIGDTQWNLWRCHTPLEAAEILENRTRLGFSLVQVMLSGWGIGVPEDEVFHVPAATVAGEAYPDRNLGSPNEEFFSGVDGVVAEAARLGLEIMIGLDHPGLRLADLTSGRAWGRWVGERYGHHRHIVWVPSYMIPDGRNLPVIREIAEGIRESVGEGCLMTTHPDPADPYCTSGIAHGEQWLDFNTIQTWARFDCIREAVRADHERTPAKPVVMAEGAYEEGKEYGYEVTPLIVRRQAYWTYLSGGHHSYGHNHNWQVPPSWREMLDAPGAAQMGVCRSALSRISWWNLVPDQSLLASPPGEGESLQVMARSADGDWVMAYLPGPGEATLRIRHALDSGRCRMTWIDPRTGETGAEMDIATTDALQVKTPEGYQDALLLITPA